MFDDYQMTPRGTGSGGYPTAYSYGTQMGNSWGYPQQQQSQMSPYESGYLSLMKKAIPNPLVSAGLSLGTSLLGGIAGLIGGKSDMEKLQEQQMRESMTRRSESYNLIKNRYAQSGNEPQQYLAQFMRATQEQRGREAEGVNQRLGLDSGVAQGEMLKNAWNSYLNYSLGAQERSRSNRDNLLAMMSQLG